MLQQYRQGKVTKTNIIVIYANMQGPYPNCNQSKVPFLHDMTNYRNIRFISLTETHMKPDIQNSEIPLEGFTPYRSDRMK